jgi:predicted TPR repeat methyltransferase
MNELPIDEPTSVLEFLAFPPQIKSYLELGVRCGRTIFRVSKLVDKAIGVDLSFQNLNIRKSNNIFLYEGSTDKFFKGNSDKFDLIFIDACHEYQQVKVDLTNSMQCLNQDGFIALHDVDPCKKYLTDKNCCGDSYKITKYIYEHINDYHFIVLHYDQSGVGILQKKLNQKHLI